MTLKRMASGFLVLCAAGAAFWQANPLQAAPKPQQSEASVFSTSVATPDFVPGSLLVKFKPSVQSALQSSALAAINAKVVEVLPVGAISRLTVQPGTEQAAIATLEQSGAVEFAEPNYYRHALALPNDPLYDAYQWNMNAINAPTAWDHAQTPGVTLGIVDTGLDYNHPEFAGRAALGSGKVANLHTYQCGDAISPQDDNGHGTHVAGIAAATGNNGVGVAGVSWASTILPFKALNKEGVGCSSDIIDGVSWLADHGAKVINMSLGGGDPSAAEQAVFDEVWNKGVLVVAASGNDGSADPSSCGERVSYPASYNHVVSVSATGISNERSYYSDCNSAVDIAAPGGDAHSRNDPASAFIISTWPLNLSEAYPSNGYYAEVGTSMASPHVAGAAALLLSIAPTLSNADLERVLETSATDLGAAGRDQEFGAGLLNIGAAVNLLAPSAPTATPTNTPIPATPTIGPGCLFSDVCGADYFFTPVQFLVSHNAVSGYGDNTFRPFNNATRGQLAKIIVLAYNWPINTNGGPHFDDVNQSNNFYSFIETAFNKGVINGYSDNTFHPNSEVTRGQLAKIIVTAANWTIDTSGGPHFSDVQTGNPFYAVIETAYKHGAISGYSNGTFNWSGSATRGQISKIVYSAASK